MVDGVLGRLGGRHHFAPNDQREVSSRRSERTPFSHVSMRAESAAGAPECVRRAAVHVAHEDDGSSNFEFRTVLIYAY